MNQTTATVRKHIQTQNYLKIMQDVKIDYTSHQKKHKEEGNWFEYLKNNVSKPIEEPSLYTTLKNNFQFLQHPKGAITGCYVRKGYRWG